MIIAMFIILFITIQLFLSGLLARLPISCYLPYYSADVKGRFKKMTKPTLYSRGLAFFVFLLGFAGPARFLFPELFNKIFKSLFVFAL